MFIFTNAAFVKWRLSILDCKLCQYSNSNHTIMMHCCSMPEILANAIPVIKTFIAASCLIHVVFCKNHLNQSLIRKINDLWLPKVAKVSLSSFYELLFQTTISKNSDVIILSSTPRSTDPHDVATLDRQANFVLDSWLPELLQDPATMLVPIIWWFAQKISVINSDLLWQANIRFQPVWPKNL